MRILTFFLSLIFLLALTASAQQFHEDKIEFRAQAVAKLRSIGTEPAKKIAYDFQNAWDGKFTSVQQDKVHAIALRMQRKGYLFYPHFYHYFSYLAYSVAQENLQRDELNGVLEINEQAVETLNKDQYAEFLFGLNIFFAKRFLSLDKNLVIQVPGGTYSFKLLDEQMEPEPEEESIEEDNSESIADFNSENSIDSFNSNDAWSNDDSWGDDSSNGGTWNDPWTEQTTVSEPELERPEFTSTQLDHVAAMQNRYLHPNPEGPVIEFKNSNMILATPYDFMKIKNITGTFLLQNRTFAGTQGTVEWPAQNRKFRGAVVQLEDFHLRKDRSDFWTPNAKLSFTELFSGEVEGVFKFNSKARPKQTLSDFPVFTSNEANVIVKFADDNLLYTGGLNCMETTFTDVRFHKKGGRSIFWMAVATKSSSDPSFLILGIRLFS